MTTCQTSQPQKWHEGRLNVGAYEYCGLYYINKLHGNTERPDLGVGSGTYLGAFELCDLQMAIDSMNSGETETPAEPVFSESFVKFLSAVATYSGDEEYACGEWIIFDGELHQAIKESEGRHPHDRETWKNYGDVTDILTVMFDEQSGHQVTLPYFNACGDKGCVMPYGLGACVVVKTQAKDQLGNPALDNCGNPVFDELIHTSLVENNITEPVSGSMATPATWSTGMTACEYFGRSVGVDENGNSVQQGGNTCLVSCDAPLEPLKWVYVDTHGNEVTVNDGEEVPSGLVRKLTSELAVVGNDENGNPIQQDSNACLISCDAPLEPLKWVHVDADGNEVAVNEDEAAPEGSLKRLSVDIKCHTFADAESLRAHPAPSDECDKHVFVRGTDGGSFYWANDDVANCPEGCGEPSEGECCTEEDGVYEPKSAGYIIKPADYEGSGFWLRDDDEYIDVRSYGYKGDGENDDAVAINAALLRAANCGSSTVYVPKLCDGIVSLGEALVMGAGTRLLTDNGVTYRKDHAGNYLNNSLGYDTSSSIAAYSGNGNITIDGGIWDGALGNDDQFTHFAIGYATNVVIRNASLLNNIDAHHIDMASCANVTIENCRFLGQKLVDKSIYTFDMLQLDANGVYGNADNQSFPYFGVATAGGNKNIVVRDCEFGPSDSSGFGNAYVGIGSHTAVFDEFNENITIDNCTFDAFQYSDIYVWKWKNLKVKDCTFTNHAIAIRVWATPAGSQSNEDRSGVDGGVTQTSSDISVTNCTFDNGSNRAFYTYTIDDVDDDTIASDSVWHENIKLSDLTITNNTGGSAAVSLLSCANSTAHVSTATNISGNVIAIEDSVDCYSSIDTCNIVKRASRFNRTNRCSTRVGVARRISDDCAINIQACNETTISYEMMTDADNRMVLVTDASIGGVIHAGYSDNHGVVRTDLSAIVIQEGSDNWAVFGGNFNATTSGVTAPDITITGACDGCSTFGGRSKTGNELVENKATGDSASTGIRGSGSPEGVVSAPLTSEYGDYDTGNLYRKASGASGNTGWLAIS